MASRIARSLCLALVASIALAGSSALAEPPAASESRPATIPFASLGGIRNFRAVDDATLLIQGTSGRWFRATFFGRCIGLRSSEKIGFMTEPGGSLDRFSAIFVDGHRCAFRSFEETEPPAKPEK